MADLRCADKPPPMPDYGCPNPENAMNDISCGSINTPTPGAGYVIVPDCRLTIPAP